MTGMTHLIQRLVAAGGVAPVLGRPAADDTAGSRIRLHHLLSALIPATYEVKSAFAAATRRPTEDSS